METYAARCLGDSHIMQHTFKGRNQLALGVSHLLSPSPWGSEESDARKEAGPGEERSGRKGLGGSGEAVRWSMEKC